MQKQDLLKHDKQNESNNVKHAIEISTYMAKLLRPDSNWDKCKSKYFLQNVRTQHYDKLEFVKCLIRNLTQSQGQRNLNLMSNGTYLLWLIDYITELEGWKWQGKDVLTPTAEKSVEALKSKIIQHELLRAAFLHHRIFNYIFRSTLQFSIKKCRHIFLNCLKQLSNIKTNVQLFPILIGLPGFGINELTNSFL